MKKVVFILILALLLVIIPNDPYNTSACAATNVFAGGDGSEDSPYLIATKAQLNQVRNYLNAHFKLTCNIVFTSTDFASGGIYYNDGEGWLPIGLDSSESFTGVFDGNGYTVRNLSISSSTKYTNYIGLFGYNKGIIKNLYIEDCQISVSQSKSLNMGASVTAGCIAGYNEGTITECYSTGMVYVLASGWTASATSGGIAGFNRGTITKCYNMGKISASAYARGSQYSGGSGLASAGGIVGSNGKAVTDCYNMGDISATARKASGYSDVYAYAYAGGIIGSNAGTTTKCYNASIATSTSDDYGYMGGIAGYNNGTIKNCYFMNKMEKGVGSGSNTTTKCTAEQLELQSTYVGFDFENIWDLNTLIQQYPIIQAMRYHIYDNACDAYCNKCFYSRVPPHNYIWVVDKKNTCDTDGIKHEECILCQMKRNENTAIPLTNSHVFVDEKDTTCDVCGRTFYQITFDSNGGTGFDKIVTTPGTSITLPAEDPVRSGYNFVGWSTSLSGNATYQSGAAYIADNSITLYAQWNKICTLCNGAGSFKCESCYGTGTSGICNTCSGSGEVSVNCGTCLGTGYETFDCGVCDGIGYVNDKIQCAGCNGHGYICSNCGRGAGLTVSICACGITAARHPCSSCKGTGGAENWVHCRYCDYGKIKKTCSTCSGQKYKICRDCLGYGKFEHSTCSGTGKINCTKCNGTGELIRTDVDAPAAPTLKNLTASSVTLNTITNGEYSIDGVIWQESPVFENLELGQEYNFYQRYAKTDTTNVSASSEALVVMMDHVYDSACDTECNICGNIRPIVHDYEWVVDHESNCSTEGSKHEECIVCHAIQNVGTVIPATGNHKYDNNCDTQCNTCGNIRVITHSYNANWSNNDEQHWRECSVCGTEKDLTTHIYDNACDATCNVCKYVRAIIHSYDSVWSNNDEQHWRECSVCGTEKDLTTHIYDNACDATCNICEYTRTVEPHFYDNVCDSVCNICGFRRSNVEHSYDNACDATCNLCGINRTPGEHVYDDNADHYCNVCDFYALLRYQINSWNNSAAIVGFDKDHSGSFSIPETINGYLVTQIESRAFSYCTRLTSVTIPNSVTAIGDEAFRGCAMLESVVIPNNVITIGDYAFYECKNMKSLMLGERVVSIGECTFAGCNLTEVVIPKSVAMIGNIAFCNNASIKFEIADIKLWCNIQFNGPIVLQEEGLHLYLNGDLVTDLVIPEGVTIISNNAFAYCTNLKSITFPEGLVALNAGAFYGCTGITSLVIPQSVSFFSVHAFKGCTALASISVADNNSIYHSSGNCIIETDSKTLVLGINTSIIPSDGSVAIIGDYAFDGCEKLKYIVIPNGVTTIKYYAFGRCKDLIAVDIPNSVTTIENAAFAECTSLISVSLPVGLTTLNQFVFDECYSLTNITIPKSMTNVMYAALRYCPIRDIYYSGDGDAKALLEIDSNNGSILYATWHYNTCEIHAYDNACDGVCNNCSWVRFPWSHTFTDENDLICNTCAEKLYIITFKDYDGTVLSENRYCYGDRVIAPDAPTGPNDDRLLYSFNGWDKIVVDCVGDATYTATYIIQCNHKYEMTIIGPNCIMQGYTTHTCGNCGDSYTDAYIAALGHQPGANATCTTAQSCTVCHTELVAAKGHKDQNSDYVCDTCNAKLCVNHVTEVVPAKEATCEQNGLTAGKKCSLCGEILEQQEIIPAKGHNYTDVITEPLCTERGYTTHTCHCGDKYVDNYVAALGHKDDDKDHVCENGCGIYQGTHADGNDADHKCDYGCGTDNMTDHQYDAVVTAPDCTNQGYTTHSCVCGHTYTDSYVAALDHEWDDATCEHVETCQNCGATRGQLTDHNFGEWIEVQSPTVDAYGTAERMCKTCGKTEQKQLDKLQVQPTVPTEPSNPQDTQPTEPTEPGHTQGTKPIAPTQPGNPQGSKDAGENDGVSIVRVVVLAALCAAAGVATGVVIAKKKQ